MVVCIFLPKANIMRKMTTGEYGQLLSNQTRNLQNNWNPPYLNMHFKRYRPHTGFKIKQTIISDAQPIGQVTEVLW